MNWLLLNTMLVQSPIPSGQQNISMRSETWHAFDVVAWSSKAKLIWVNVKVDDKMDSKGHWPVIKLWGVGVGLQDATTEISTADEWADQVDVMER